MDDELKINPLQAGLFLIKLATQTTTYKMKRIFILGNGFDLNLGLKTSYSHFIESTNFQAYRSKTSNHNYYSLAEHLQQVSQASSWVDIEIELAKYSASHADSRFLYEYHSLCGALSDYLSVQQSDSIKKNTAAHRLFLENYRNDDEIEVITFNYTNTAERLLQEIFPFTYEENEKPYSITYVHGSISQKNIIFGVDDSHKIAKDHIKIRKTTHENFSGHVIKNALFEYADEIHFFGVSLGETDHMYFREYFRSKLCKESLKKKHKFYVYKQEGYDDLHNQFYELTNCATHNLKIHNLPEFIRLE